MTPRDVDESVSQMNVSDADKVSLKELLTSRLEEMDRRFALHLRLNALALEKFESTLNARLESMNEFRESLKDQSNTYMARKEIEVVTDRLAADLVDLRDFKNIHEGKASQASVLFASVIAVVALVMAAIELFIRLVE